MGKVTGKTIFSIAILSAFSAGPILGQACATKPVETASGPALGCAAPGAACSPAENGGGAGKCVPRSVKTGPNASRCVCAAQGVRNSADPEIDIRSLIFQLATAKRGDVFNFSFTAADLTQQQTNVFSPNLFDANPKLLSMDLRVEVIALGKRERGDHWGDHWKDFMDEREDNDRRTDTSSPSLTRAQSNYQSPATAYSIRSM
jgi:hypothetical protein